MKIEKGRISLTAKEAERVAGILYTMEAMSGGGGHGDDSEMDELSNDFEKDCKDAGNLANSILELINKLQLNI